jgi:glycosyltransferase involved in cell wall biosynthesis
MPEVSVIIPTYNRANLVSDAIASVMAQSFQDLEIIVADDGSTDDTAAVVARFGDRIRYLPLPHRGQPAATRNAGLAIATGEYVAFLDSDDLFLPDKLARQVPVLKANPDIGLVYSNGYYFDTDPTKAVGEALDGLAAPSGNVFGELLCGNFIMTPALALMRRSVVQSAGGFDESHEFIAVEDYALWLRIALQSKMQFVAGNVAAIRRHNQNLSANRLRHRQRIDKVYRALKQRYPDAISEHKLAYHEGNARNHGGIAQAALQHHQFGLALRHAVQALWHTSHLPGFGLSTIRAWWRRYQLRASTH